MNESEGWSWDFRHSLCDGVFSTFFVQQINHSENALFEPRAAAEDRRGLHIRDGGRLGICK